MAGLVKTVAGSWLGKQIARNLVGSAFAGAGFGLALIAIDALFPQEVQGEVGKLNDLKYMGSSYGSIWPRIWGSCSVGGQVIYLQSDRNGNVIRERKEDYRKQPDEYFYTFTGAIGFCAASLSFPDDDHPDGGSSLHRGHRIRRVWANNDLIYEADASGNVLRNDFGIVILNGTETQNPPSGYVAISGDGSNTPAHRGIAYIWCQDFSIDRFGRSIPQFKAEIVTNALEVGDVISDICRVHGLKPNQFDVSKCFNAQMPGGTGMSITGFIWNSREEGRRALDQILSVYDIDMIEADGILKFVPRANATVIDIPEEWLGAGLERSAESKLRRKRRMIEGRPTRVILNFLDADSSYNQSVAEASRQTQHEGSDFSFSTNVVMKSADAQSIARRTLDRFWLEFDEVNISIPTQGLLYHPGDVLRTTSDGVTVKFRADSIQPAPIGPVAISGTIVDDDVIVQPAGSAAPGNSVPVSQTVVPSVFTAFSASEILDSHRSSAGLYVAASGDSGWRGGRVFYKLSTDTEYIEGPFLSSSSVFGTATSALSDSGAISGQKDNSNTVSVSVGTSFGTLLNAEDGAVQQGANWAWLGNEIIGFTTATLTGPGLYTLSGIYRGLTGTTMSGHASGEQFVLATSGIERISVPDSHVGQVYNVKVVSIGQGIDDVTAQNVTIIARRPTSQELINQQVIYPVFISPINLTSSFTMDGSWRSTSVSGIPPNAVALILYADYENSSGSTSRRRFEVRKDSVSPEYKLMSSVSGAGGDTSSGGDQVIAPVGSSFQYKIDPGWIGLVEVVGYYRAAE